MIDAGYPILSSLIFFPLLMCLVLAFVRSDELVRVITLAASVAEVLLALPLFGFDPAQGFQFVEQLTWVPQWGLSYYLGVDGISLLMVMLTVGILPLCVLCSWTYIGKRIKEFHICLLLMTAACIGVFCALDFVLFYVFWEAMLVPMYLLIAVWGGPERRYASIKFFLYTLAGSTLLLVAMVAFFRAGGTFSIPELMERSYSFRFQFWAFLAMALAFAIKVPMFPFHTWLPAAHVQAPSAGSVILASVLLKMGTYGFLRFCLPLTPAASAYFAPVMIAFAIASIIYGGFVALGQSDIKKLIAYSSVGHMGFAMLGIFLFNQRGVEGTLLVMLNHGIVTGALFMMIGLIYERSHSREITANQGLGKFLPAYMGFWGLFALSSFGFPGLNSFVGEAAVMTGAFQHSWLVGALVVPGAMLAAAYMLRLSLRMAWGGPASPAGKGWRDMNSREWVYLAPLAVLTIWLGVAPGMVLRTIDPAIERLLADFQAKSQAVVAQVEEIDRPLPMELAVVEIDKAGATGAPLAD
ncbi:NADH-quinone oxidoreductase subunit M [Desulfocurvibacter africanus]|uniref:Proton-translocating NADH-quinone oxidoreductase, chain M n=1 Tax=Desulfocurvibacter africanus subsp. africanus str. Walvis Bay TaxID=690850 RepID=F3Z154_DESAF|nr:NADH-quinone oxidoreductase subunit M [Desulfocurvibacter africanus]EGJ49952.1 proton-translocating NADH-quinone oxidoreductase, chain M [Desulfocurvibacter africanus subsp. africanus str. Walvis Bay]